MDSDRHPGRFIITGSANLLTASGTQESLAGRAQTIRVHGFSQGELRSYAEDFASFAWSLNKNRALPTLPRFGVRTICV